MRAISRLSPDDGMSTVSCAAVMALRIRVRKSAMGSVIDMRLPAALRHPRDEAVVGELAQADPADAELAVDGTGAATTAAPAVFTGLVLRGARLAHALGRLGHFRQASCRAPSPALLLMYGLPSRAKGMPSASRRA